MTRYRRLLFGTVAVLLVASAAWALLQRPAAPDARFETLTGERFSTSDLRGRVVLVNFWATSCVTCVKEMPMLAATQRRFESQGYTTIAIAMSYDPPDQVRAFVQRNALPFKVVLDTDGVLARRFGEIRVTPTTFILDKRGRVLKQFIGEPDKQALHALLQAAIEERMERL